MHGMPERATEVVFHGDVQDTECAGWRRIVQLVDEAVADGRVEFAPRREMTDEEWAQLVTLPGSIGKLKAVRHLLLYASHVVRIPPEIGEMSALERFEPYTSTRLHWLPYEITRCAKLVDSTISTRCLYGNYKYRPSFPRLEADRESTAGLGLDALDPGVWGCESIGSCSVCGRSMAGAGLCQVWITLRVATDDVPLLVNACSPECVGRLPSPAKDYVAFAHKGGLGVEQPAPR